MLIVLAALCVLLFAGYFALTTSAGRAWIARKIENVYADQVTGTLEIGEITRLSGFTVDATGLRFLDPRAEEVITIERAHLGIAIGDLLDGRIRFTDGRASGGHVRIVPGRTFSTSLEDAFGSRGARGDSEPLDIDTGVIAIDQTLVVVGMGGPRVRLARLDGAVRVFRYGDTPIRVEIERFKGILSIPQIDVFRARRFTAGGLVHAEHDPVLDLRVRACLEREEIPVRIRFTPGRLHMRFDPSENRLAGMMLGAAGLSPSIVTERGPVSVRGIRRCSE